MASAEESLEHRYIPVTAKYLQIMTCLLVYYALAALNKADELEAS